MIKLIKDDDSMRLLCETLDVHRCNLNHEPRSVGARDQDPAREGQPTMASFRKHGKIWYFRYVNADGANRERKGCSDRRATEDMARAAGSQAAKVCSGLVDLKEIAYRDHLARPLSDHLGRLHRGRGGDAQARQPVHQAGSPSCHWRRRELPQTIAIMRLRAKVPGRRLERLTCGL
jgi:hypothetical protein